MKKIWKVLLGCVAYLMLFVPVVEGQNNTITGQVTDGSTGELLPGVNIVVKGTTTGTSTDSEGKYELTVPSLSDTLVFSFVGFQTREVPIEERTTIDISLNLQSVAGEELVVVGYGTQRRENLTGSVSDVGSEKLTEVPVANSSELLVGRAPGLITKQTSALPGNDATDLSIRGFGNPLVLVDGIEMSFNKIDPNNIASISVLKDASAAIYGARAGNGVILVTTKRGIKDQPPEISYHGNLSMQQPTAVPDFTNAAQFTELLREGELNYGLEPTHSEDEIANYQKGDDSAYESYDWYDALARTWTPMQQHNISVSGGSEIFRYHLSSGLLDQASIFESGDWNFQRYNARSNVDAFINDNLTASLDISFRKEIRETPAVSLNAMWNGLLSAQPVYPPTLPDPTKAAYSGFLQRSPVAATDKGFSGFRNDEREYIRGTMKVEYDFPFVPGLSSTGKFSYYFRERYDKSMDKPFDVYEYDRETDEYTRITTQGSSRLQEEFWRTQRLYPKISLEYASNYEGHSFEGLFIAEWINSQFMNISTSREDLASSEIPYLFAGSEENIDNDGSASEAGRASYIGRLNYSYQDKYLLESTMRLDASHKFPENSRWGLFPSVSVGWKLSEEGFIRNNLDFIEDLKLRLSYSQSGDDDVGAFRYLTGFNINNSAYIIGDEAGGIINPTGLPNPDITWLDMTIYNAGLDASFWDDQFGFEFDVFYRRTENIFGTPQRQIPSTFGASLPQLNINTTDDRGFEFLIRHQKTLGDFSYSISANAGLAREKYVRWSEEVYEDPDEIRIYKNEGNYVNRWIGYVSDGIFMDQEEINNYPIDQDQNGNSTLRPGDIKYKDLDGDSLITWRDQKQIGYGTEPDLTYGMDITVNYKEFELSALLQGASMFNMMIDGAARTAFDNFSMPYDYHYKYRWQPDPDNPDQNINPDARLPAIDGTGAGTSENNDKVSDFWLQNATYLRLKNLNASYSIPNHIIEKMGLKQLKVYIAGNNLLTFSNLGIYKGTFDPEGPRTQTGRTYPPVRTVTLGLNISL